MDYEKKYNEALKWMRELYPGFHGATKEDAEHYFPELCESEDEQTRRRLVEFISDVKRISERGLRSWAVRQDDAEMCNAFLSYLEKQKEQKPVDYEAELKKCKDNPLYFYDKYVSIKLKPADDKAFEEWIDDWWKHNKVNNPDSYDKGDEIQFDERGFKNFCRGIRNMYQQKPAEWSEEDEKKRKFLIKGLEDRMGFGWASDPFSRESLISWLKSLRPSWKPSEQEKGALRTAIHILTDERNFPKAAAQLQNILDAFEGKESRKDWKPGDEQMEALRRAVNKLAKTDVADSVRLSIMYDKLKKL